MPKVEPSILILKLDHNQFGAKGVEYLSNAIAINPILKMLSLSYCSID